MISNSSQLGHNLGLLHSNEVSELYGDLTGYMVSTTRHRGSIARTEESSLTFYCVRCRVLDTSRRIGPGNASMPTTSGN